MQQKQRQVGQTNVFQKALQYCLHAFLSSTLDEHGFLILQYCIHCIMYVASESIVTHQHQSAKVLYRVESSNAIRIELLDYCNTIVNVLKVFKMAQESKIFVNGIIISNAVESFVSVGSRTSQ